MKTKQTARIADQIRKSYQSKDGDLMALKAVIKEVSAEDDLTIFIRTRTERSVTNKAGQPIDQQYYYDSRYEAEMFRLNAKLQTNSFDSISEILTNRTQPDNRTLEYAGFLDKSSRGSAQNANSYVMFIFSPLYPMHSTVEILAPAAVHHRDRSVSGTAAVHPARTPYQPADPADHQRRRKNEQRRLQREIPEQPLFRDSGTRRNPKPCGI